MNAMGQGVGKGAEGFGTYRWCSGHLLTAGRTSRLGSSRWVRLHASMCRCHGEPPNTPTLVEDRVKSCAPRAPRATSSTGSYSQAGLPGRLKFAEAPSNAARLCCCNSRNWIGCRLHGKGEVGERTAGHVIPNLVALVGGRRSWGSLAEVAPARCAGQPGPAGARGGHVVGRRLRRLAEVAVGCLPATSGCTRQAGQTGPCACLLSQSSRHIRYSGVTHHGILVTAEHLAETSLTDTALPGWHQPPPPPPPQDSDPNQTLLNEAPG